MSNCSLRISFQTDELISALSLDLPEQARLAAVQTAVGAMAGADHSQRTKLILQEARSLLMAEQGLERRHRRRSLQTHDVPRLGRRPPTRCDPKGLLRARW